ncbi:uncharacterized protein DEA37_0002417 [Paragonimus westermani]|uniref:Transmembrane protein n=1 Tax=Paragonimus westermani TaxID=34504 RepID=A0A5J4NIN6_9TREM|nr:uncharacterized protein DEA37_0002417 [Paragonimus westermani]
MNPNNSFNFQLTNWNEPVRVEGSGVQSATPDQHISEPSRSTMVEGSMPDPLPVPFEPAQQVSEQRSIEVPRMPQGVQEPGFSRMSHPDDESFVLHHQSSSSAPRMIQQSSSGRSASQNAFKRLKTMGSAGERSEKLPSLPPPGDLGPYGYPTTKTNEKKPETRYPGYKTYQATRCLCCFTTFSTLLLVVCGIITILIAIVKMKEGCQMISAMIVLMNVIMLAIVTLEWIRLWVWREPTPLTSKQVAKGKLATEASMSLSSAGGGLPVIAHTPGPVANATYPSINSNSSPVGGLLTYGFQQRLYDVPQFVSALCLVVLYGVGGLCICGTIVAAGAKLEKCSQLSLCGIGFGAILAILFSLRMVMCCMSDACRGLLHRSASAATTEPVPMVAVNQLHQVLPGMGKHWQSGDETHGSTSQPTAWLVNLANASDPRQQLSFIRPMPTQYVNDLAR